MHRNKGGATGAPPPPSQHPHEASALPTRSDQRPLKVKLIFSHPSFVCTVCGGCMCAMRGMRATAMHAVRCACGYTPKCLGTLLNLCVNRGSISHQLSHRANKAHAKEPGGRCCMCRVWVECIVYSDEDVGCGARTSERIQQMGATVVRAVIASTNVRPIYPTLRWVPWLRRDCVFLFGAKGGKLGAGTFQGC